MSSGSAINGEAAAAMTLHLVTQYRANVRYRYLPSCLVSRRAYRLTRHDAMQCQYTLP